MRPASFPEVPAPATHGTRMRASPSPATTFGSAWMRLRSVALIALVSLNRSVDNGRACAPAPCPRSPQDHHLTRNGSSRRAGRGIDEPQAVEIEPRAQARAREGSLLRAGLPETERSL